MVRLASYIARTRESFPPPSPESYAMCVCLSMCCALHASMFCVFAISASYSRRAAYASLSPATTAATADAVLLVPSPSGKMPYAWHACAFTGSAALKGPRSRSSRRYRDRLGCWVDVEGGGAGAEVLWEAFALRMWPHRMYVVLAVNMMGREKGRRDGKADGCRGKVIWLTCLRIHKHTTHTHTRHETLTARSHERTTCKEMLCGDLNSLVYYTHASMCMACMCANMLCVWGHVANGAIAIAHAQHMHISAYVVVILIGVCARLNNAPIIVQRYLFYSCS